MMLLSLLAIYVGALMTGLFWQKAMLSRSRSGAIKAFLAPFFLMNGGILILALNILKSA